MSINKEIIVMGAVKVRMSNGNVRHFLTTMPDGTELETCERHGITYKDYACPSRFFNEAINTSFPFVADVFLREYGEKLKIDNFKIVKVI